MVTLHFKKKMYRLGSIQTTFLSNNPESGYKMVETPKID